MEAQSSEYREEHRAVMGPLDTQLPMTNLLEQGDIVREIIGPDERGEFDLRLPTVLRAIVLGAAAGASQYFRTHGTGLLQTDESSQVTAPDVEVS